MMKPSGEFTLSQECKCQVEMVSALVNNDENLVLELLTEFGDAMRKIVSSYERNLGRLPTADEIKWVLSEQKRRDIAEMIKERYAKL
jgi:hypothetical protein